MKGMKTGGRKKGTPNKITQELGEKVSTYLEDHFDDFARMMGQIVDPEKYCYYYIKALDFRLPRKAAVSVSGEVHRSDLKSELMEIENSEN